MGVLTATLKAVWQVGDVHVITWPSVALYQVAAIKVIETLSFKENRGVLVEGVWLS